MLPLSPLFRRVLLCKIGWHQPKRTFTTGPTITGRYIIYLACIHCGKESKELIKKPKYYES